MPKVSIIIRTKNEEQWIRHCLKMVFAQTVTDIEVVIVDSGSTDNTLVLARDFPVKIVNIPRYVPGLALNDGIRASTGEYIVCLSAHCVPKQDTWLEALLRNFEIEDRVGGVYGRQVPVKYSDAVDKRDLMITFGLDRRVQLKDAFFHNANSILPRRLWDEVPFDEELTNIEDRAWAQQVIQRGYKLVYEPDAVVYHHHGIHHGRTEQRCRQTVNILEAIHTEDLQDIPGSMRPENAHVVAFLPLIGPPRHLAGRNLLERAIAQVRECPFIDNVCVVSELPEVLAWAEGQGAVPIHRGRELLGEGSSVETSLTYALSEYERRYGASDIVAFANYLYPFRPRNFFSDLLEELASTGVDSTFAATRNYSVFWVQEGGQYRPFGFDFKPKQSKNPIYQGVWGLGGVSAAHVIRSGRLIGETINLVELHDDRQAIQVREGVWAEIAAHLLASEGAGD